MLVSDVESLYHVILDSVQVEITVVQDVDGKVPIQVGTLHLVASLKVVVLDNQTAQMLLHQSLVQVTALGRE